MIAFTDPFDAGACCDYLLPLNFRISQEEQTVKRGLVMGKLWDTSYA